MHPVMPTFYARMTQRRIFLFAGAYLAATALMAWLAFFLGRNEGLSAATLPPRPEAVSEHRDPAAFVNMTENVWSCDPFRGFPGLRANHRERVCGPGGGGPAPIGLAGERALERAFIRKIAGSTASNARMPAVPSADETMLASLYDSPESALLSTRASAAVRAGGPVALGGPPFPDQPLSLLGGPVPNGGAGGGEPGGPGGETPPFIVPPDSTLPPDTPEVPLPGALPFMLTGFAGLLAARRRRRR